MKHVWNSMIQAVSQSVKTLSEGLSQKTRHDVVLMTTGISVMTMLTFSAGNLGGHGGNTMVAFAETQAHTVEAETELEMTDLDELVMDKEQKENETVLDNEEVPETAELETVEAETEATESETEETETETEPTEPEIEETETDAETEESVDESVDTVAELDTEEITLPADEYQVLLRIVQAEAGICDEDGKLLIANVILNRMESDEFPDTVSGVVYQRKQFSPVMNGTINTCKVTEETINAVDRALNGEDISEGALYFMNRGKSASRNVRWFDENLDYLFKHGSHEFYK